MNLFRWTLISGLVLNFGLVLNVGCDGKDTDTDTDTDTDSETSVDEDCDNGRDDDGDDDVDCDDSECRNDAACEVVDFFEPYVIFVDGNFLYNADDDTIGTAIGTDGSPIPPTIAITVAEEAYFKDFDDRYTCIALWTIDEGTVAREELSDGELTHAGFWMPGTATFQTNCENWDPDVWGDDLEAVFNLYEYSVGVGAVSTDMAKDSNWKDFIANNTSADFPFDEYVLGGGVGLRAGENSQYGQSNWAMAYAVDADFNIIVDDEGNGTILNNTDVLGTETGLPPTAYYRIGAFYGFDAEAVYLGG